MIVKQLNFRNGTPIEPTDSQLDDDDGNQQEEDA